MVRVFERGPCGAGEGLGWKRRRRGMRCAVAGCGLSGASGGAAAAVQRRPCQNKGKESENLEAGDHALGSEHSLDSGYHTQFQRYWFFFRFSSAFVRYMKEKVPLHIAQVIVACSHGKSLCLSPLKGVSASPCSGRMKLSHPVQGEGHPGRWYAASRAC